MIVTRYKDGSEGHEFEVGDVVRAVRIIAAGSWLRRNEGKVGTVVRRETFSSGGKPCPTTDIYEVQIEKGWGPSRCLGCSLEPVPETKISRVIAATI